MNILVLGGTVFVGRHLVAAALARGHEVTLFNRGREAPGAFPGVEHLVGDRRGDLAALRGRRWDAAIDVAAYTPSVVENAARVLSDAVDRYAFVSTRSVYADSARSREGDPLCEMSDADVAAAEVIEFDGRIQARKYGEHYGALKVRCERAAERAFGARLFTVRPGLIVGPFDPSDRFTYWVRRVARGGDVLAPGRPERTVRFIDARDLAAWVMHALESGIAGTFNAGGAATTMGTVLNECHRAAASDARLHWVREEFLLANAVEPWSELPLWLPAADNAFMEVADERAVEAGLRYRPLADTVRDTLAWDRTRGNGALVAGMSEARETELLASFAQSAPPHGV